MSTTTRRLLLGSGAAFLLTLLTAVGSRILYEDSDTGPGATAFWVVGTLAEVATVALLVGAAISALVRRSGEPS